MEAIQLAGNETDDEILNIGFQIHQYIDASRNRRLYTFDEYTRRRNIPIFIEIEKRCSQIWDKRLQAYWDLKTNDPEIIKLEELIVEDMRTAINNNEDLEECETMNVINRHYENMPIEHKYLLFMKYEEYQDKRRDAFNGK